MGEEPSSEITRILEEAGRGAHDARDRLLSLIYGELHQLAAGEMRGERADHTLQPTALIHEAFVKLFGGADLRWENRAHFYGAAAQVMRRILVDHARARNAERRGGGRAKVPLETTIDRPAEHPGELLAVHAALEKLEAIDEEKAQLVQLRFFAGLKLEEIAALLETSVPTLKRRWRLARAWLYREIEREEETPEA